MRKFRGKGSPAIRNAERIELRLERDNWKHVPADIPQLA